MYAVRSLLLLALATTMTYCVQAQNVEGQPIAAQYGEFQVQSEGNGFAFDPANCNVTGGGVNFPAFTTGTPIKVVDPLPAQTEVSTMVNAFQSGSECAVSLGGLAYQHTSFYLTSGTGGLQEALNNGRIHGGGNNTIILNGRWYQLIAPRTASTVISTVIGSYSFGLVDITTNPYTSYNWNGSQYVQVSSGGGSPTGAAGGALSGSYPNPGLSSNPITLPAGSTATTCTAGENDTKVATNACVAASASSGGAPSGPAGGSLAGTYPNPVLTPAGVSSALAGAQVNQVYGYPSGSGSSQGVYQLNFANSTAATNAQNYASPNSGWAGTYWNGSASTSTNVNFQLLFGSGNNPTQTAAFTMGGTPSSGAKIYTFDQAIQSTNDGIHSGLMSLVGNTTPPSIPSNSIGFMGPNSASFTSYVIQLPATGPASGQVLAASAPVSGVSTGTFITPILPLIATGAYSLGASGSVYGFPAGSLTFAGSEAAKEIALERSGTIARLMVCTSSAQPADGALTLTFRTGPFQGTMATQTVTVTFAASAAAQCVADTTHSFAYVAGNAIDLLATNGSLSSAASISSIYAELQGPN